MCRRRSFSLLPLLDARAHVRKESAERRQKQRLSNRLCLGEMEVALVAEVGRIKIKLAEAQKLGVGDIVRFGAREGSILAVYLGGNPKFLVRPFISANGEIALKNVGQIQHDYQHRYGYIAMCDASVALGD